MEVYANSEKLLRNDTKFALFLELKNVMFGGDLSFIILCYFILSKMNTMCMV